ncbi:CTR1 suppressor protein [Amniculicola lignicola CBS 123094]|uniref:CTR1 suppressor protein n=1 Tax=Amniculicola lignicola CBS 123094 TaxID=1392246 RepID=A0A6A5WJ65_9PLEO|nr:CTR1 suppressor protein [Amniculicola lignicola CBS 123094]
MNVWVYDVFLWVFTIIIDLFFREIHPRSSWKIPDQGPVIFVCAPHANQFVDPLIVMRVVKKEKKRRIHVLTAEKSMKRSFVGRMAALTGAVPVGRAMDLTKPAPGKIYLPRPINDPCIIHGSGVNFQDKAFEAGGLLVLPQINGIAASAEIKEIRGPEEIVLKRPFKGGVALQQLTGRNDMTEDGEFVNAAEARDGPAEGHEGTNFKVAPKLNQQGVYDRVHDVLHKNGTIGIFPEGGSHDRTELLPLKAGVAIMALGTLAEFPECNLKIIPVGMNYFHAHKFRSRAVIEFGTPLEVSPDLVEMYKGGDRRDAIASVLETVRQGLMAVTVTAPDYETLMLTQAVRRLYNTKGKDLPLGRIVELNRRLAQGYAKYKDDPRVSGLKADVIDYNKKLLALNMRDHQVSYGKKRWINIFFLLIYRLGKIISLTALVAPGALLFSLVFLFGKIISIKKSREALAASTVKIEAKDVLATWKILVALAVAPLSYLWWITIFTYWYKQNGIQGYFAPGWPTSLVVTIQMVVYPCICYSSLRFGEVGMDIVKSLWPLFNMLLPGTNGQMIKLQKRRSVLAERVNALINELGPEMYEDFEAKRIISGEMPRTPGGREAAKDSYFSDATSPTSERPPSSHLPRNESFGDLNNTDFFSTRPSTPKKSRSRTSSTGGFKIMPFSTIDGKSSLKEVNRGIKEAMKMRGRRRSSAAGVGEGYESSESGTSEGSEGRGWEGEGLQMTKKNR